MNHIRSNLVMMLAFRHHGTICVAQIQHVWIVWDSDEIADSTHFILRVRDQILIAELMDTAAGFAKLNHSIRHLLEAEKRSSENAQLIEKPAVRSCAQDAPATIQWISPNDDEFRIRKEISDLLKSKVMGRALLANDAGIFLCRPGLHHETDTIDSAFVGWHRIRVELVTAEALIVNFQTQWPIILDRRIQRDFEKAQYFRFIHQTNLSMVVDQRIE